jgi:hypothetical protein
MNLQNVDVWPLSSLMQQSLNEWNLTIGITDALHTIILYLILMKMWVM